MPPESVKELDLASIEERLARAGEENLKPVGVRDLEIGPRALESVGALARMERSQSVTVLTDANPKSCAGRDVGDLVVELLSNESRNVRRSVIGPTDGRVHADAETVEQARRAALGSACLVTVGSGTVTDIGKLVAADAAGSMRHVVVQTATSVNGYSDDQSVVLVDGVKRTLPSSWPAALIADTRVLMDAPTNLNLAGVGDLVAMFTAPADWSLAWLSGMADSYSAAAVSIVRDHGDRLMQLAPGVRERQPAAIEFLAALLAASGISMGVTGTTAPASGMEHAVSHLVEMAVSRRGQGAAYHGAQVGAATVLASLLWSDVREHVALGSHRLRFPTHAEMEDRVHAAFDPLDPEGRMAAECWRLYRVKLDRWNRQRSGLERRDWAATLESLSHLLLGPDRLVAALVSAGVPVRFSELDQPIDAGTLRWSLANCHLMRDRFSVADLAFFLGIWEGEHVEANLARATELGAGF